MARTFNLTLTGAQEAPTPVASGAIGTGTVLVRRARHKPSNTA